MIPYASPQQQAWWQNFLAQQQQYHGDQIARLARFAYQQRQATPSVFGGLGPMANALLGQANPVSSTGLPLFRPTAAGNPYVQEMLASAGQAGDTGISSNPLLMQSVGMP